MVKVWLLLMLMSSPNQPSVKYTASIFPTEEQCVVARAGFMELYEAKPEGFKLTMKTKAICVPFEAFPIKGMPGPIGA